MSTHKKTVIDPPQGSLMGIIIPNKKLFKMAAILQWEDLQTCKLIYWLGLPKRARAEILKEVTSVEGEGGAFEHKNAKKCKKTAKKIISEQFF